VQCLDHYNIPLLLNHNIVRINGKERVESVTVAQTDERKRTIFGTEKEYECDTVLLSVGLIPENELSKMAGVDIDRKSGGPYVNESMETSVSGIFACGNVAHVHDVVDFVTEESMRAGANAARFVKAGKSEESEKSEVMNTVVSGGLTYCVPHRIRYFALPDQIDFFLRTEEVYDDAKIIIKNQGNELASFKKRYITPGEMIKLNLKKTLFENAKGDIEIMLDAGGSK
jgi:NADH dehydrogenase FAD-containing subunit